MGSNDSLAFAGDKSLGIDYTAISATAEHKIGMLSRDADGRTYMYVKAGGANLAVYAPVKIATGFVATASGSGGSIVGVPQTAITAAYYGWVVIKGECTCHVTDAQAAGVVFAWAADANGDAVEVTDVDEDGVADVTAEACSPRGIQLVTEDATDSVSVFLF